MEVRAWSFLDQQSGNASGSGGKMVVEPGEATSREPAASTVTVDSSLRLVCFCCYLVRIIFGCLWDPLRIDVAWL